MQNQNVNHNCGLTESQMLDRPATLRCCLSLCPPSLAIQGGHSLLMLTEGVPRAGAERVPEFTTCHPTTVETLVSGVLRVSPVLDTGTVGGRVSPYQGASRAL